MILINEGSTFVANDISLTILPGNTEISVQMLQKVRNSNDCLKAIISGRLSLGKDGLIFSDDVSLAISYLFGIALLTNTTLVDLNLDDIGITIGANSSYYIYDKSALKPSSMLLGYLSDNSIVMNNGTRDLSLYEAIQLMHDSSQTYLNSSFTEDSFSMLTSFDFIRNKLLSTDTTVLTVLCSEVHTDGWLPMSYYVGESRTSFLAPLNGTVVGISAKAVYAQDLQIYIVINNVKTLITTSVGNNFSPDFLQNIDFNMDDTIRLCAGTGVATDLMVSVFLKWRQVIS